MKNDIFSHFYPMACVKSSLSLACVHFSEGWFIIIMTQVFAYVVPCFLRKFQVCAVDVSMDTESTLHVHDWQLL